MSSKKNDFSFATPTQPTCSSVAPFGGTKEAVSHCQSRSPQLGWL